MKFSSAVVACLLIAGTQATIHTSPKISEGYADEIDVPPQAPPIGESAIAANQAKCPIENQLYACGSLREDNDVPEDCECASFCNGDFISCASLNQDIYGLGCTGVLVAGCQASSSSADDSPPVPPPTPVSTAASLPANEEDDEDSDEEDFDEVDSDEEDIGEEEIDEEDSDKDGERADILIGGVRQEENSSARHVSVSTPLLLLTASFVGFFL